MDGLKGSQEIAEFKGPFVDWEKLFKVFSS
jgi:hypothetical protein